MASLISKITMGQCFEFFSRFSRFGGTTDKLQKLLSDDELMKRWMDKFDELSTDQAVSKVDRPLGEDEYLVRVTYAPLPSMAKLKMEFGKSDVSDLYDGRPFKKHESCARVDETPCDRIFLVKHFGRSIKSEEAIAEMDKLGYRPATHLEAYAFQKAHPDMQRKFRIVALGSFAMDGDGCCVMSLHGDSSKRSFGTRWSGGEWHADDRLLFVRK